MNINVINTEKEIYDLNLNINEEIKILKENKNQTERSKKKIITTNILKEKIPQRTQSARLEMDFSNNTIIKINENNKIENINNEKKEESSENSVKEITIDNTGNIRINQRIENPLERAILSAEAIRKYVKKLFIMILLKIFKIYFMFMFANSTFLYDLEIVNLIYLSFVNIFLEIIEKTFKIRKDPTMLENKNFFILF